MAEILPSYLAGRWMTGTGAGAPVHDAVDGAVVTHVSTEGLDLAEAVRHATEVGGPALREAGFQARAAMLKAAALAISERKQELYDLSARAGCTRADAKVDVDGGFGTALVYASLGRSGLPEGNLVVEDAPVPLGRQGTFVGQHVLTPRRGVAVQINAFNFPVWGMLEKLAPALIAGVPSIVKPASQTAYVAEHAVRIMVEAGVFPEGSVSLVSGPVPGLLDLLGGQDLVGFTGSASTAALLRSHAAVTERSVRFNAEADSLNSSILGPDAVAGTPEFDLFVDAAGHRDDGQGGAEVHRHPARLRAARAAGRGHVGRRRTAACCRGGCPQCRRRHHGCPRRARPAGGRARPGGPAPRRVELVFGDPERVDVVGGDAERGAFLSPLLLVGPTSARAPHEVEAFGPVSTLLPYDDTEHLVELVARGEGSLVASVVSHDPEFVRAVVTGIAAHHGRVLVLDRDNAAESTGHGTPMPQLVHGGPGRAGGGEEEGGLRAVHAPSAAHRRPGCSPDLPSASLAENYSTLAWQVATRV